MKVILYYATSINGYITHGDNDSDWVSETDWEQFNKLMKDCRIMLMGSVTYEYFGDDFPVEGALNVVMTHQPELLEKGETKEYLFTDKTPEEVIKLAEKKGFQQVMLIGGMNLVTSFMKNNLIDEIWLSVHPLFIGDGKPIIEKTEIFKELEFLGSTELSEGLIQLRYEVIH